MNQSQKPQCLYLHRFVSVKSDSSDPYIHDITYGKLTGIDCNGVAIQVTCVIEINLELFQQAMNV